MTTPQQVLTTPSTGANLPLVQAFLDFIATKLSADDYTTAQALFATAYAGNKT